MSKLSKTYAYLVRERYIEDGYSIFTDPQKAQNEIENLISKGHEFEVEVWLDGRRVAVYGASRGKFQKLYAEDNG